MQSREHIMQLTHSVRRPKKTNRRTRLSRITWLGVRHHFQFVVIRLELLHALSDVYLVGF